MCTLYAKIITIVDICNELLKVQELKEKSVHVSYSKNSDAFKIKCSEKNIESIKFSRLVF
ncbi:hypothetical protein RIR_e16628_A0A2N1N0G3_9GLOM [Rhizophagus irregularis DAOM 181602=DAOM 197198]|nr:hypothetical protein RIR_e16628_A0A2N1N0G3_9GLOM [Rhizophagus irregularis DAOM 181602=DAOM 197198]